MSKRRQGQCVYCGGDGDLQQELILWVIDHLVEKKDVNEKYIIQRLNLQVKAYRRGYLKERDV